jgi:hypothetical protein
MVIHPSPDPQVSCQVHFVKHYYLENFSFVFQYQKIRKGQQKNENKK